MSVLAWMPSGLPETTAKSSAALVWLQQGMKALQPLSKETRTSNAVSSTQATLVASWGSHNMLYQWNVGQVAQGEDWFF
jgi:hypothetical protein